MNGCTLGNPYGKPDERVFLPEWSQLDVRSKEATSKTPAQLALRLLGLFFTKEEIAKGNCTEAEGRELLSPQIIEGIRCKNQSVAM